MERRQAISERGNTAVPPKQADADRRIVTVLFADLCGFTALGERLDPETLRALQNELFEELNDTVNRYGGYVDKFIGDALLALFGAPVANEGDPERALLAALDMKRRVKRIEGIWSHQLRQPLPLHIGVNTGPVVAGTLGAGDSKSYSVTGDTVNTAQRLQAMAGPGDILVGAVTERLTRHAFSFEGLGTLPFRGKAEMAAVYRLEDRIASAQTPRGLEILGLRAPMIGRDTEISAMVRCLELVFDGATQLVRLIGEAGIGKTRLVKEFLDTLADDPRFCDVVVRQVACSSLGDPSYGTLASILRCAYGIDPAAPLDLSRQLLERGLGTLGLDPEQIERWRPLFLFTMGFGDPDGVLTHLEPDQLRRQIFHATLTIFERRLQKAPLLLVIEDLHWADVASLEVLRFVMDRLGRNRLMLLITHRPAFETNILNSAKASLTTIRLAPLGTNDSSALLSALLGGGAPSSDMRDRIVARASGNPFFLEEILRNLMESGVLRPDGPDPMAQQADTAAEIPVTIQALILARFDRLPADARRLAQAASVIGTSFDIGLLRSLQLEQGDLQSGINLLCEADILEETADDAAFSHARYRFRQKLFHEVIYDNLLVKRRSELHGLVGEALERRTGALIHHIEQTAALGYHFVRSTAKAKGATYLIAAGDLARKAYANEDAIKLYGEALAALDDRTDDRWLIACERLADLSGQAGRRDTAVAHYNALLDAYRAQANDAGSSRILRKLGRLAFDAGNRDRAQLHFSEAASLLDEADAPIEEAELWHERGHLAFRTGEYALAVEWADKALRCVSACPIDASAAYREELALATANALNLKGIALARMGRNREAIAEVENGVNTALDADLPGPACRGYTNLSVLYTDTDPALAIDVCTRGYAMAKRIGDLGHQARLLTNLAVAYCTFTDRCMTEGLPAAKEALALDQDLDQRDHLPVPMLVLGQIYQCHGQADLAREHYLQALELARDSGEAQLLFPCYDGLATLSLDCDDVNEAERYFDLAQEICAQHGLDPEALMILPFLD